MYGSPCLGRLPPVQLIGQMSVNPRGDSRFEVGSVRTRGAILRRRRYVANPASAARVRVFLTR